MPPVVHTLKLHFSVELKRNGLKAKLNFHKSKERYFFLDAPGHLKEKTKTNKQNNKRFLRLYGSF